MINNLSINPMWFIFITLSVSLIPIILGVCTSYLKISIVLTLLRNGFGTQQFPGNILILVLSFSLSLFIMFPVYEESYSLTKEFQNKKFSDFNFDDATKIFQKISVPWKDFMLKHAGKKELKMLTDIKQEIVNKYEDKAKKTLLDKNNIKNELKNFDNVQKEDKLQDESFSIVLLAFVFSELKEAFAMSVSLLVPFLVIDIIVANILVGLGMYMLTPSLISLPIKILIFVLIDGWLLLGKSLILSFGV